MRLKKTAIAGTLESGDIQITIFPCEDGEIHIELESIVKAMFGDAIIETVNEVLKEFEIDSAVVQLNDKGALDHVIRSRMQAVICRAAEADFDWSKEG